ncbi:glycosyltransferase [Clostridium gasigenes]|uniref:glycosyltransferase n=1 Tax=Clostridium gasigenes TaxID=94869 RepID=UPI001625AC1B|nr:glycosyltransferase [Clostridium gasigenes]MBB6624652.1 glycosyltransferase [Clostridium gasigenes]MBU3137160.1 glycosyltransferase [Clostridium gasigenes]
MKKTMKKIFDIEFYKYTFLVCSFLYTFPITSYFMASFMKLFIIWGILVLAVNFNEFNINNKNNKLLLSFIIITFLSSIFNYKNNFANNIIMSFYIVMQIIVIYNCAITIKKEKLMKHIKNFALFLMIVTFLCAIVSLIMAILNTQIIIEKWNTILRIQGVFEGRLWGIYGNANTLATLAVISFFISIVHSNFVKNKFFNYVNCIIQFFCILLTNSRASLVAVLFTGFVYIIILLKNKKIIRKFKAKNKKKVYLLMIIISIIGGGILINSTLNANFILKREYNSADVTNGRVAIWQGGIKSAVNNILLGVGPNNVKESVNPYLNSNYVKANPDIASNMHNIFLQVFVSYGSVALLLLIWFILVNQKKIFTYLIKSNDYNLNRKKYNIILSLNSIILSLLIMNCFDSNIIFFFSLINVSVFWISMGYINKLIEDNDENKKSILFIIDNLAGGGAEKVLSDIVSNINKEKYNITVQTLFNEGVYIEDLKNVFYKTNVKNPNIWKKRLVYRIMMYIPAKVLHILFITDTYDCEIAFLETGVTKIISGRRKNTKSIAWVHADVHTVKDNQKWYFNHRSYVSSYKRFSKIVCVSNTTKQAFIKETTILDNLEVLYNPINEEKILQLSKNECNYIKNDKEFLIVAIGRLEVLKSFDRLLSSIKLLVENNNNIKLLIIGEGSERNKLESLITKYSLTNNVELMGFQKNPYKFLKEADLFVSSSISEGFSLVIAEAMILSIPVLSTNTAGPNELLEYGKYGCIVENNEVAIYEGIKSVLMNEELLSNLRIQSLKRKDIFKLDKSMVLIEELLERI